MYTVIALFAAFVLSAIVKIINGPITQQDYIDVANNYDSERDESIKRY